MYERANFAHEQKRKSIEHLKDYYRHESAAYTYGFDVDMLQNIRYYKNEPEIKTQPVIKTKKIPIIKALVPKDFTCDFSGLNSGQSPYSRYKKKIVSGKKQGSEFEEFQNRARKMETDFRNQFHIEDSTKYINQDAMFRRYKEDSDDHSNSDTEGNDNIFSIGNKRHEAKKNSFYDYQLFGLRESAAQVRLSQREIVKDFDDIKVLSMIQDKMVYSRESSMMIGMDKQNPSTTSSWQKKKVLPKIENKREMRTDQRGGSLIFDGKAERTKFFVCLRWDVRRYRIYCFIFIDFFLYIFDF